MGRQGGRRPRRPHSRRAGLFEPPPRRRSRSGHARRRQYLGEGDAARSLRRGDRGAARQGLGLGSRHDPGAGPAGRAAGTARGPPRARRPHGRGHGQRPALQSSRQRRAQPVGRDAAPCLAAAPRGGSHPCDRFPRAGQPSRCRGRRAGNLRRPGGDRALHHAGPRPRQGGARCLRRRSHRRGGAAQAWPLRLGADRAGQLRPHRRTDQLGGRAPSPRGTDPAAPAAARRRHHPCRSPGGAGRRVKRPGCADAGPRPAQPRPGDRSARPSRHRRPRHPRRRLPRSRHPHRGLPSSADRRGHRRRPSCHQGRRGALHRGRSRVFRPAIRPRSRPQDARPAPDPGLDRRPRPRRHRGGCEGGFDLRRSGRAEPAGPHRRRGGGRLPADPRGGSLRPGILVAGAGQGRSRQACAPRRPRRRDRRGRRCHRRGDRASLRHAGRAGPAARSEGRKPPPCSGRTRLGPRRRPARRHRAGRGRGAHARGHRRLRRARHPRIKCGVRHHRRSDRPRRRGLPRCLRAELLRPPATFHGCRALDAPAGAERADPVQRL